MLVSKEYNRSRAYSYAKKYAFTPNPVFGDFSEIGGNCTNFVSQCIYAGGCQMNYTPTYGWYYLSLNERAPAWTGVEYFYKFITSNEGVGPYGTEAEREECEIGDVVQLGRADGTFYHTLIIVGFEGDDILLAAQTDDAFMRPLSSYTYDNVRFIRILGIRFSLPPADDCIPGLSEDDA